MKRIALTVLVATLFLFCGLVLSLYGKNINHRRIVLAERIIDKSVKENNSNKIISLIQSDILVPADSKKLAVANIYLRSGNFDKANFYLKRIKDEQGLIRYAESALIDSQYTVFDKLVTKIDDTNIKNELLFFKRFSMGDQTALQNISTKSSTDTGKFLDMIKSRDYKTTKGTGILSEIVYSYKDSGQTTLELGVAKDLLELGQKEIALFLINRVIDEKPSVGESFFLRSKYFESKGDINKALYDLKSAISANPSVINYYENGSRLSNEINDKIEKSYFDVRLEAILSITN